MYHNLKGEKGVINPHLADYHEIVWEIDNNGGLLTGHCAGSAESGCPCTVYRPRPMKVNP